MCKASLLAKITREAEVGDELVFSQSPHGLPILRRAEDDDDCPTCIKMGRKLSISSISPDLQRQFGVGETAEVIFVEDVDDTPDSVQLPNGTVVDLYAFIMDENFDKMTALVGDVLSESSLLAFVDQISGRTPKGKALAAPVATVAA